MNTILSWRSKGMANCVYPRDVKLYNYLTITTYFFLIFGGGRNFMNFFLLLICHFSKQFINFSPRALMNLATPLMLKANVQNCKNELLFKTILNIILYKCLNINLISYVSLVKNTFKK